MSNQSSSGAAGGRAPVRPPAGTAGTGYPWHLAALGAFFRALAFLATAALVAAAVSYYMVSQQVPRELAGIRGEWAGFRSEVESRLERLEHPEGPAEGSEVPGQGREQAPGGSETVGTGGPGSPGSESGQTAQLAARIRLILVLLSGQDRLGWALAEVSRQDWGMAAESVGAVARAWEALPGMEELAAHARACQAELSACDTQGMARLRLLWSESQKTITRLLAGLPAETPADNPPP